jgi:hypothetical protein
MTNDWISTYLSSKQLKVVGHVLDDSASEKEGDQNNKRTEQTTVFM